MKVCLLNDSFPPVIDGVVNVMMNYADYLRADFGDEIAVGTPRYPGADYSAYPYKVIPYMSLDTAAQTSGYRTGNPFDGKSVSALAAFQPELIHAHCPASALVVARLLRAETGAPIVLTYHTKYEIDIARFVKSKLAAKEGVRAMVGNIEACDEVWTVSHGAGESLKALGYQGDYRVMNNGVDFPKGRVEEARVAELTAGYDLPPQVPLFLYVGRLMTYKGLPIILDALKRLDEAGQDFRMVFVGKGPDQGLLEEKVKELGLEQKCFFTGPVYERETLRAWNTRADLFLFPSTFDTNGLVVREAAACGLASVLIAGSCAAEGITDGRNGYLVEENAESLAAKLLTLCPRLEEVHAAGERAMEEIYLSWRDCVAEARERYGEILEAKRAGTLPRRHLQLTDLLVDATAVGMSAEDELRQLMLGKTPEARSLRLGMGAHRLERLRHVGQDLFHNFRDTAAGMMENMQEDTEEELERFRSLLE
ncbi:MAG: glycosyltransferase, partial [bacterium]